MSQNPAPALDPNQNEVRTVLLSGIETRAQGETGSKINGIAVVYDEFTKIRDFWGDEFYERIEKGALKDTLADGHDIFALKNHNWDAILGRTGANLTLSDESDGLHFELIPNNSTQGRDILEDVRSKLIKACSFGFRIIDQSWDFRENAYFRTIHKLELREITLTPIPAYASTTAEVRSLTPELIKKPEIPVLNAEQEERNALLADINRIEKLLSRR